MSTPATEDDGREHAQLSANTTSRITMDAIKTKLEQGLGATHVDIEDMSGTSRDRDTGVVSTEQISSRLYFPLVSPLVHALHYNRKYRC